MMEKAFKTVSVELKDELVWDDTRVFLKQVWYEIMIELDKAGDVVWSFSRFLDRVNQEVESRKIDLRKFRNNKNEPITNMFKRIVKEIAKENGIELNNDALSRILNHIRSQYSSEGILTAGLYPVEAFFKREEYGITEDLGDEDSCFRVDRCNEGNALWFMIEDKKYDRAKFVVFHYKSGGKEGWGRCWMYKVSDGVIFATNFYSRGFDIKSKWLRYSLVRALRKLAGLSGKVRFANGNIDLPIYLHRDGLIIYEKDRYSFSEEVIEEARNIQSEFMYCGKEFKIAELGKYDKCVYYSRVGDEVKGLIVCERCAYNLDDMAECKGCGVWFYRDEMFYQYSRYWCEDCYNERFITCVICNECDLRKNMIVDSYGNWLCSDCVDEYRERCAVCNEYVYSDEVYKYKVLSYDYIEEVYVCNECEKDLREMKCEQCGYEFYYRESDFREDEEIREIVKAGLCPECYRSQRLSELCENKENLALSSDPLEQILVMENVIVQD